MQEHGARSFSETTRARLLSPILACGALQLVLRLKTELPSMYCRISGSSSTLSSFSQSALSPQRPAFPATAAERPAGPGAGVSARRRSSFLHVMFLGMHYSIDPIFFLGIALGIGQISSAFMSFRPKRTHFSELGEAWRVGIALVGRRSTAIAKQCSPACHRR